MQAGKAYMGFHSLVAGTVYSKICTVFRLEGLGSRWKMPPKSVEIGRVKILWCLFLDPDSVGDGLPIGRHGKQQATQEGTSDGCSNKHGK